VKIPLNKIVFMVIFGLGVCFAQESLAIYTSGASEAAVNKSLSGKLLTTMSRSGVYAEIGDPSSFQDELANGKKNDLASVIQTAKRYGADYVCVVNITEVFGSHSTVARMIKISSSQVIKTVSTDRSLKSLEDLTVVSNELARQLLPPSAVAAPPAAAAVTQPYSPPPPQPVVPYSPPTPLLDATMALAPVAAVAQGQCARTYNINELLSKIKDGFPAQLKDCSSKLAKDMLTPASFGGKKLEPKSFMTQCPIDGIKKELPDGFPNVDKVINSLTNFVQGIMNTAMAGAALDPKKLVSAVSSMNVNELLNEIKSLSNNECVVDEPYAPQQAAQPMENFEESNSRGESGRSVVSFGIRAGLNESNAAYYGTGHSSVGSAGPFMQFGAVLDIAARNWLHIQPGLMYIQKGKLIVNEKEEPDSPADYLEIPFLISFKASVFRFNSGPYFSFCLNCSTNTYDSIFDVGFNHGIGIGIGMFYIEAFVESGFVNMGTVKEENFWGSNINYFYNSTVGFNLGINL